MDIKSIISSYAKVNTIEGMELSIFVLDNSVSFFEKTRDLVYDVFKNGKYAELKIKPTFKHFTDPKECMLSMREEPSLLIFEFFLEQNTIYSDGGVFMDAVLENYPNQNLLMTSDEIDPSVLLSQINKGLGNYVQKGANLSFRLASFINEVYAA